MNNLSKTFGKLFDSFKNTVLTKFGPNPAKMLIYTGVLGWFLSSAAQVVAIAVNDNISKEQKSFLIPQEIGDGAINVLSFLLVTSAIKKLGSNLVSTGKLATPEIREFLKKSELGKKVVGDTKFNIEKLSNFSDIAQEYVPFKNGVDVISATVGSILSCNLITPVLRNKYAADRQHNTIMAMNKQVKYPKGISMDEYRNLAALKFSSNGLKI